MAQTLYSYSVANDTLNGALAADALDKEIRDSAIVIALDYVSALGDDLSVYMKDALSAGDETILNGVVAAHTGVQLAGGPQEVLSVADPDAVNAAVELKISQVVTAGQLVAETYVVPNGQTATVKFLEASCPDSALAVVRLVWDYDAAGETDEWIFQRSNVMPKEVTLSFTGDGVKKLALCAENSCNSDYYYNAFAKIEVV